METTYKIIGGDGAEYGPVPLDELKAWIVEGRVGGRTQVWRSDQSRWLPALQYQELQPEIGQIEAITSEPVRESQRPVGFWVRVGAYLLDGLVLYLVFLLIWGPLKVTPDEMNDPEKLMETLRPMANRLFWMQLGYFVLFHGGFGATVGKMVLRARVTNLDGSPIGFLKALVRWLVWYLCMIPFGLGFLVVPFRKDKRGLHDLTAGTKVIYRD
jgi:uncharacterized RDD family membrane protein YckC